MSRDPSRRIVDFSFGGPALLMHCDNSYVVTKYQTVPPYGPYNLSPGFYKDSSNNNHLIMKIDAFESPYENENSQIRPGGKFSNCIRGRAGTFDYRMPEVFWPHHNAFNFGNGDFTVDFWYKGDFTSTDSYYPNLSTSIIDLRYPHIGRQLHFGIYEINYGSWPTLYRRAKLKCYVSQEVETSTFYMEMLGTTTPPASTWNHCALVKREQSMFMYLNGILEGSMSLDSGPYGIWDVYTSPSKFPSDPDMIAKTKINVNDLTYIWPDDYHSFHTKAGFDPIDGTSPLFAYFDELRIIKGAQFTGPFTPPTQPY